MTANLNMQNSEPVLIDRLLRIKDVEAAVGFKKTKIYGMIRTGEFPKPYSVAGRIVAWRLTDINAFISNVIRGAA